MKPLTPSRTRLALGTGGALWLAAVILWREGGLDKAIQLAHNTVRHHPPFAEAARILSTFGLATCVGLILASALLSVRFGGLKDFRMVLAPVLVSFAIAAPIGDLSKMIFARPRPFIQYPAEVVPITRPPAYSLPSGHSTKSFALALPFAALVPRRKRRWIVKSAVILVAAGVAYSRIVLGVHYLGDILAGIGIACLTLPLAAATACAAFETEGMTERKREALAAACGAVLLVLAFTFVRNSL